MCFAVAQAAKCSSMYFMHCSHPPSFPVTMPLSLGRQVSDHLALNALPVSGHPTIRSSVSGSGQSWLALQSVVQSYSRQSALQSTVSPQSPAIQKSLSCKLVSRTSLSSAMPLGLWPLLALLLLSAGGRSRQLHQLQHGSHQRQQLAQLTADSGALCGLLCALRPDCTALEYNIPPVASCLLLGCDPGWSGHLGFCYRASAEQLHQSEANQACRDLHTGARLTSIHSEDEQLFVDNLVTTSSMTSYLIGLRHKPSYGPEEFRWMDGSSLIFDDWFPSQPDGNMSRHIGVHVIVSGNRGWFDTHRQDGFVCKYAA